MTSTSKTGTSPVDGTDGYPLRETADFLDERLGLYLSEEQKKGFATGLLVGAAIAGALVAWSLGTAVRKSLR